LWSESLCALAQQADMVGSSHLKYYSLIFVDEYAIL